MERIPAGTVEDSMKSVIEDLKAQARVLHRAAQNNDPAALQRLRRGRQEIHADAIQRRHCLAAIARELGFTGWQHATAVLAGDSDIDDFGTLLYPPGGAAHTNIWCASYDQARTIHARNGGFLLAYKRQYFIVDRYFIETLGLNPDDPDWQAMGHDWARPADPTARARMYARLIRDGLRR
jgi:hypothetical protein